jgi:Tfp pilus assembly protein PilW
MNETCRGVTLTELLIAMAAGMLLVGGLLATYAQARSALDNTDRLLTLEERLDFALAAIEADLLLAGFWGLHADSSLLVADAGLTASCGSREVTTWLLRLDEHVAATTPTALPCPTSGTMMADTDALVIRHADADSGAPRARSIQLQTNQSGGRIFADGSIDTGLTDSRVHNLRVHAWHVATRSSEPGMPALRRHTLVHGQRVENQEIMPGIDDLQVAFVIDSDGDGFPDREISDPAASTDYSPAQLVAVRVTLTARTPQSDRSFAGRLQSHGDGRYRRTATRIIRLRNRRPG